MNLLDMVKGQLSDTVMGQLSSAVGLGKADTSKAMDAILPTQLNALINQGSSPQGAQNILGMLGNFGNMGNIMGMLGKGDSGSGLMKMGESLLPMLFGNKMGDVLGGLASATGIGNQNALSGLMKMAGPILMGTLAGQAKGMNPMQLVSMLGGMKGQVDGLLPKGMGNILGSLGSVAQMGQQVAGQVGNMTGQVGNLAGQAGKVATQMAPARAGLPWWIPLLALLAVGGCAYWFLGRGKPTTPAVVTPPATETTTTETPATTEPAPAMTECSKDFSLLVTDGQSVSAPFRFGGEGKGKSYTITVKRGDRIIGSKELPLNADCAWGYDSTPEKGAITYVVNETGGAEVATVNLTVE
jgi:hypothetical protein